MVSVPVFTFMDAFGVYRNMQRSLMGIYNIPAGMTFEERSRNVNVFPITLGPHGSNDEDVLEAIQSLIPLDQGVMVDISGTETLLCVYTIAFLGDMLQQNKNSGIKGPGANCSCRFCTIKAKERNDVDFDIWTNGRYHHQLIEMRQKLASFQRASDKREYEKTWGLDAQQTALVSLAPALDLVLGRPGDPYHSEANGIADLTHNLLLNLILKKIVHPDYVAALQKFPFPPGWQRLQSPIHHLRSYGLSEHARWSIIIPLLLRSWLKPKHIQNHFQHAVEKRLIELYGPGSLSPNAIVEYITSRFNDFAKSNSLLLASELTAEDRGSIREVVRQGRISFQWLSEDASAAILGNPRRSKSRTPGPKFIVPSTSTGSGMGMLPPTIPASQMPPQLGKEFREKLDQAIRDSRRPNVHAGLHYEELAEEYGIPGNIQVLSGEAKHK